MAEFEETCAELGILLFVLPPRSPKLNGHVERAQRTHKEEFYDLYMGDLDLESVNSALREWERNHNTVRPHHSLGLLTRPGHISRDRASLAPKVETVSCVDNQYRYNWPRQWEEEPYAS